MKRQRLVAGITETILIVAVLAVCASAQAIFFDDFNGSFLDVSQWKLTEGSVQVAGGQLRTAGNPDHKRIDSNLAFGTNDVTARARINLNGRYQKFGFFGNSEGVYFFDTLGDIANGGNESVRDKVYAIVIIGSTRFRLQVSATWGQFHEFSIKRATSSVTFFVDGQQVGQVPDVTTQLLPVGVWNDRPEEMLTDWVEVQQPSARAVTVVSTSGASGATINVPIELTALGNENALGFSLTYDQTLLSNPQSALGNGGNGASLNTNVSQTSQGRYGVALALPTGQTFAAGERQLVIVTFLIASGLTTRTTTIGFGDQPIRREVVDTSASTLPAFYTYGTVTITPGYEADVSPRPNGNNSGTVTIADWVQTGRFAAGLDTAGVGNEFQRADCAPKETKGDGRMSIADWVQAGRYAAGLDAVVAAGGPTAPVAGLMPAIDNRAERLSLAQATRAVRLRNANVSPGQQGTVTIELDAMGNENALGFSLGFDAAKLRFVAAALGTGATGATLNSNTAQATNGRVGFAIALPTGQSFVMGTRQLIVVTFAAQTGASGTAAVAVGDSPIAREIVDVNAQGLTANWTAGSITIARTVTNASAASFSNDSTLASEAIVAAFGTGLATTLQAVTTFPLPTTLAGTTVRVLDAAGVERLAPLFFVSPTQVNYLVPPNVGTGDATVTITSSDGTSATGRIRIARVAPGLFSVNSTGEGLAAAVALRVKASGEQTYEPIARLDATQNKIVAVPLDLGAATDQVFLVLYGTGLRGRTALSGAQVTIGGTSAELFYVGAQGSLTGLDQVNVRVPRSLAGRGDVNIALTVDGVSANVVTVNLK